MPALLRCCTLIEAEHDRGGASPNTIARWLAQNGYQHGYAESSLRPKVYLAREFITDLEAVAAEQARFRYWRPFDPGA